MNERVQIITTEADRERRELGALERPPRYGILAEAVARRGGVRETDLHEETEAA